MSIERSHGRARVTRPRLSDVSELPDPEESAADRRRSGRDSRGRFAAGNAESVRSSERHLITRRERAALTREISTATCAEGEERVELLRATLKLYGAAKRDLPALSPVVLSSTLAFAREHVVAAYLHEQAVVAGLATEQGLALLDAAQKAEARAERASLHALTMSSKLATDLRGKRIVDATPWLVPTNEAKP